MWQRRKEEGNEAAEQDSSLRLNFIRNKMANSSSRGINCLQQIYPFRSTTPPVNAFDLAAAILIIVFAQLKQFRFPRPTSSQEDIHHELP